MLELEVEIRGPYASQPPLVKLGSLSAFVAFVLFLGFVPPALAVAVLAGVGTPATNWKGTAGALALTAALAAVGAGVNCRFLAWLRGGRLARATGFLFVSATTLASAAVATIAAALGIWPRVFLVALALVPACLLASFVLTNVGRITRRRRRRPPGNRP